MSDAPAPLPTRVSLRGRYVDVVPLDPERHAESLFIQTAGADNDALWEYLSEGPFHDRAAYEDHLRRRAASTDPLFFATADRVSGLARGRAALMRIEPRDRVIEVGHILFGRDLRRTRGATEAMYLLARYVFEDLGYRRYEWKCDALNAPSRAAALRLGFTFEGIFRQHMIVKGRNRDTAWFSMIDTEWPDRKTRLERWLDPSNFDAHGRQLVSLHAV
jgi:RimJ/RimL family protein N-acetyltransferase